MTLVTAQMSVSLDGFYAGPEHTDMATWMEGPEAAGSSPRRSSRPVPM
jgi:hypothetical protein